MTGPMLDLDAIERDVRIVRDAVAPGDGAPEALTPAEVCEDTLALVAEVRRLRAALAPTGEPAGGDTDA